MKIFVGGGGSGNGIVIDKKTKNLLRNLNQRRYLLTKRRGQNAHQKLSAESVFSVHNVAVIARRNNGV
jgi:hypothetical protein